MGEHGGDASWAMVPNSGGELWASNVGEVAILDPAGGFDILPQRANQFGERFVLFKGGGRKTTGARMVASMVLAAFGRPRLGGHKIVYEDGDPANCRLANLSWRRKGQVPVGDMKPRRCLGNHCGHATFLSSGDGNRLCSVCARVNESRGDADGIHVPGEIPDAPSLAPPATKRG